jgi:hypothetical protein
VTKQVRAEEPRREEPDKLLRIAGLVNGYHNDGTKLSAAETLAAIADVLGDPFDFSSSAVVVGADQQVALDELSKLAHHMFSWWQERDFSEQDGQDLATFIGRLFVLIKRATSSPALPDPGSPEREKELLAALKAAVNWIDVNMHPGREVYDLCQDAIAKAESALASSVSAPRKE